MLIASMHIRRQHAKGSGPFHGPDTYVAVTVADEHIVVPYVLNPSVLRKRGIKLLYYGEGYREHNGPRSMLGRAIREAQSFCVQHNLRHAACTTFGLTA